MEDETDHLNAAPLGVQFLAICYVGFGCMLIVLPWIAPAYIGFHWLWLAISLGLVFVGWRIIKLGIRISKHPSPYLWRLSLVLLSFIILGIIYSVWVGFHHYPSAEELLETKAQYAVARIYLNLVLGIGLFAIWTQLFTKKVKDYFLTSSH